MIMRSELINKTEKITIGDTFKITNMTTADGKVIFEERKCPGSFVEIATTNNGYQPRALITIDCDKEADHFEDKTITAFVPLYEGYHIITINKNDIVILKVLEVNDDNVEITVKCLFKFNIKHIPNNNKFEYAINYTVNRMLSSESKKGDYFAINRNRHYELRIMYPGKDGMYYGFNNEGKKLLLNKKSLINVDGRAKLMRVFYNNKFANENVIIVDGFELEPITIDYVNENYDELTSKFGADVDNIYTMSIGGLDLITVVSRIKGDCNNFNIKVVYKSWKSLSVLLVNGYESKSFEFDDYKIHKVSFGKKISAESF